MNDPIIDGRRFRLFFWHEWSWLWDKDRYNWIDIHWLWVHCEYGPYKYSLEANFGLLGFCLSVDWFYGQLVDSDAPHPTEEQS